jgi:hypothetical protein
MVMNIAYKVIVIKEIFHVAYQRTRYQTRPESLYHMESKKLDRGNVSLSSHPFGQREVRAGGNHRIEMPEGRKRFSEDFCHL